mmetsp:Transcript_917/g.946  ORF Transcript_917/g.946 Transcript_917/m.946 type:complete len:365 (+) Transcript_917:147-1241(+)
MGAAYSSVAPSHEIKKIVKNTKSKKLDGPKEVQVRQHEYSLHIGPGSKKDFKLSPRIEPITENTLPTASSCGSFLASERITEKVAVIGAGSFGTSMATVAARNHHSVLLYARDTEQAHVINTEHRNPKYLSQYPLLRNIRAVTNVKEALQDATVIIFTLPAQVVYQWIADHAHLISPTALMVNTAKGLDLKRKRLLSDAVRDGIGRVQPYVVLSGPSFAKEIMQEMPTAVVAASLSQTHCNRVKRILHQTSFMVYTSEDVIGVELGGALKNPLAIGAGVIQGLGLGSNTMSTYVTLASLELQELCVAMGGEKDTMTGLAGAGDLMLTAFGDLSRNRNLGKQLAEGLSLSLSSLLLPNMSSLDLL